MKTKKPKHGAMGILVREAAKPSPLPSPAPTPWKRGHDLGHAFQVVKSRHQNEWVIVAEAITAKDADLIVRAVNGREGLVRWLKAIADASLDSTVEGLKQGAREALRAAGEAV